MKTKSFETLPLNLDDEPTVRDFISTYGTKNGIRLANLLGIKGKGSKKIANNLSCYAWNKFTAINCRLQGKIVIALNYEAIADKIYSELPEKYRW